MLTVNHAVLSSILSPKAAQEILTSNYHIGDISKCELWKTGVSDVYRIEASSIFFLKVYKHGCKNICDLNFEKIALEYLNKTNINASNFIKDKNGGHLIELNCFEGVRYGVLFSSANGAPLDYKDINSPYLYGSSIARLHLETDGYRLAGYNKKLDICSIACKSIETVKLCLVHLPEILNYFEGYASLIIDKLNNLPYCQLDYGFCHGDLHGGNLHCNKDEFTFYDFDYCGFGLRAYDIAVFRWGCRLNNKDIYWKYFINGYKSIRNVSDNDLQLSSLFVAVRDIHMMAHHIDQAKILGKSIINDVYIKNRISFLKAIQDQI